MAPTAILWRRLDVPGHDACRLVIAADTCVLSGAAAFAEDGRICALHYEVTTDARWRTRRATVRGVVGDMRLERDIAVADGAWTLDGLAQPALAGLVDLDLGFTPATNLLAIRRLALAVGQSADAPAAYLAFPQATLGVLPQRYTRIAATRYAYASPTTGYRDTLEVTAQGWVTDYPGLFRADVVR